MAKRNGDTARDLPRPPAALATAETVGEQKSFDRIPMNAYRLAAAVAALPHGRDESKAETRCSFKEVTKSSRIDLYDKR